MVSKQVKILEPLFKGYIHNKENNRIVSFFYRYNWFELKFI